MQLRFASLVVINLWQDFHLQVCAHAGRTSVAAGMTRWVNPPYEREWAQAHRAELQEDWELCSQMQQPKQIQPLE